VSGVGRDESRKIPRSGAIKEPEIVSHSFNIKTISCGNSLPHITPNMHKIN
jgi:hypothetical protein